jgi:hypothetical protein
VHHNSLHRPAILLAVLVLALTLANDASAQRGEGRGRGFTFPALGPATEPAAPRTMDRHDAFLEIARAGDIDLLFVVIDRLPFCVPHMIAVRCERGK